MSKPMVEAQHASVTHWPLTLNQKVPLMVAVLLLAHPLFLLTVKQLLVWEMPFPVAVK
jgi:hypothetical protein